MKGILEVRRGEQDGLVTDAVRTAAVLAVWGWENLVEAAAQVFGRDRATVAPPVPDDRGSARATGEPKTLREIGLDGGLAADFETAFRLLGATEGDRIIGYRFRTTAGVVHPLRLEGRDGLERAA